jgi:phenylpropionate dioxygenase-like ring-hydroxylating dioxygenase large terminal subunit
MDSGIDIQRGASTSVSPPVSDLLRHDSRPVEPAILRIGGALPPPGPVPASSYTDPAYAKLEHEHVWSKCWQVVGREEDLPEIGDRKPYTCGPMSYIIIRSGADEFRALRNSCLHRGNQLCSAATTGESIRCSFHAWEWNVDGSLRNVPSRWDFPDVSDAAYRLPEARLARWGGFLFINPDPNAAPLEASLGVLATDFRAQDAADRFTLLHVRKKLRANWKVVLEAFLEAYHVIETHSDSMGFTGDANTQYDIYDDGSAHVSRLITPLAVPSPHLGETIGAREAGQQAVFAFGMAMPGVPQPTITSGLTARAEVAEWRRATLGAAFGHDFSQASDSYMLDAIQYYMFPNFGPWLGEGLPVTYQFTPGADPNESVMEIRLTAPLPDTGQRPPAAEMIELDYDTPISSVPAFGVLARVFDQDFSNLPTVQLGLRTAWANDANCVLGRYQECRIRHLHDVLEAKIGGSAPPA